jgi:hypothetical protein
MSFPKMAMLILLSVAGRPGGAAERVRDAQADLLVVRRAADALLEHGRDRWGERQTGMIISILDRRTLAPPERMPPAPARVRAGDRTTTYGSNANIQLNLYRVLFALTDITGDPAYRSAGEEALLGFVRYTQSAETGLFGWGEHLCYDLREDRVRTFAPALIHEMKRKLLFWDFLHAREPQRMEAFAEGLWLHGVADHQTGNFSRHARWDVHGPERGYDFSKEAGYMIDVWSHAYAATGREVFRQASDTLARRYMAKMTADFRFDYDSVRRNYCNHGHNLTLAIEAHDAAERYGCPEHDPLGRRLRDLAAKIDRGFLAAEHAVDDPQRGFIATCLTDSGQPADRQGPGPGGYSVLWGMGYGRQSTAMIGMHCFHRAAQLGEGPEKDAYRRLFLQAAGRYLADEPPDESIDLWPMEYGVAVFVQLAALRLTDQSKYLQRAVELSQDALEMFWSETSRLPKASRHSAHYEAITGADTLLLALLATHAHRAGLEVQIPLSELDR